MSKTSTAVKARYNKKTYSQWNVPLRKDFFDQVEQLRGDMSRAKFLKMLIDSYTKESINE